MPQPKSQTSHYDSILSERLINLYSTMQNQAQQHYDSIRPQEQQYEKQIRSAYKEHGHLFVNHSSDLLNLAVVEREAEGVSYEAIVGRNTFEKYDIIAQIRGSLIREAKLQQLIADKKVDPLELPPLLHLHSPQKYLLSPKNITKHLFLHPLYLSNRSQSEQQHPQRRNCYIDSHFDSKLFVTALRPIVQGEELVLEHKSYKRYVYKMANGGEE